MENEKPSVFLIQSAEGMVESRSLIIQAVTKAGAITSSTFAPSGNNLQIAVLRAIHQASLVIADVSDIHPNVMFEIGLSQAQNKPIILIASNSRQVPFDLASFRIAFYDGENKEDFFNRLTKLIQQALEMPEMFTVEKVSQERKNLQSVFISYSHNAREYLDRLLVHLKPLEREGLIDLWMDTRLRAGDRWKKEIETALARANVTILLVSADFLASDFITNNELPPLLRRAEENGTRIIPVIIKPCRFTRDKNLKHFQAINDPKNALALLKAYFTKVVLRGHSHSD